MVYMYIVYILTFKLLFLIDPEVRGGGPFIKTHRRHVDNIRLNSTELDYIIKGRLHCPTIELS